MNEHLELWENDEKIPKIRAFDTPTKKWFAENPERLESLTQCPICRLFHRDGAIHFCEEHSPNKNY